jgi:site-specific recombinase XerD
VRFDVAIDEFVADWQAQGHMNSDKTERDYRLVLDAHCDDVSNRDPRYTSREDVKRTLRRWRNPNSQRKNRSILITFYRWTLQEGMRPNNPAEQTARPKTRPTTVERLSREEIARLLPPHQDASRERFTFLSTRACGTQSFVDFVVDTFQRPGFIVLTPDITKGKKGRPLPVVDELAPIANDIRLEVSADHFVFPAQRWRNPPENTKKADKREFPSSSQALRELVRTVARRAGIRRRVYPHLLRHAFADHMVRHAGL